MSRAWYLFVGGAALLATAGHVSGAMGGGSRFDGPLVVAGVAIGALSLAAGAWVLSPRHWRGALAWSGIAAGFVPLAVGSWIAVTSAAMDAQVLVGVPTLVGLVAMVRMAMARATRRGSPIG